jgi:hypothetical protein
MPEGHLDSSGHPSDREPIEVVRTKEPQAPVGQDEPNPTVVSDATSDDLGLEGEAADPGLGGYQGRDPAKHMPKIPSAPGTQHDEHEHGGAPDGNQAEQASSGTLPRPGKGDG